MIRWILFDAAGTLIHAFPSVAEIYRQSSANRGYEVPTDVLNLRFRTAYTKWFEDTSKPTSDDLQIASWRRVVQACFPEVTRPSDIDQLFNDLWQAFADPMAWRVDSETEAVLAGLKRSGVRLGIASNFDQRITAIIRSKPALRNIERIFGSASIGWSKPNLNFYREIESQLQADPSELLLVGDSLQNDVDAPLQAGWNAIHYDPDGNHLDSRCRITHLSQINSQLLGCGCGPKMK